MKRKVELRYTTEPAAAPRVVSMARGPVIVGYAAVFHDGSSGSRFDMPTGIEERVMPGAFDQTLKEDDALAMFNHCVLLGRASSRTLRLSCDARGLRYEIALPNTQDARDLAEFVQRGDVAGSSFSFRPRQDGDRYYRVAGKTIRELRNVRLLDVGPAIMPAYTGTTCAFQQRQQPGKVDARSVRMRMAEVATQQVADDQRACLQQSLRCGRLTPVAVRARLVQVASTL